MMRYKQKQQEPIYVYAFSEQEDFKGSFIIMDLLDHHEEDEARGILGLYTPIAFQPA